MPSDSSIRAFKCPTCGAPLNPEPGQATMKCPYCSDTVIIPAAARTPATLQAIPSNRTSPADSNYSGGSFSSSGGRLASPIAYGILGLVVVCLAAGVVAYFGFGVNPFGSLVFANQTMAFGAQGIGQGMFQDARAIGVDGNGNVVVADYEDGRVQVFNPTGKFISLFNVSDKNGKTYIQGMAVSHDGKIFIAGNAILIYDENGQLMGKIGDENHYYEDVALGTDGTLYALSHENIVRFNRDNSIDLEIPNAVSSITGNPIGFAHLAVDGLGDMYITDSTAATVFKYSPGGKFIDQFGGEAPDAGQFEPGKFVSPMGIAVDGYGRIFINDFFNLQVFDPTGKYIDHISGGYYGIAFDQQSNLYATSVTNHNVVKFQIRKPSGEASVPVGSGNSNDSSQNSVRPTQVPTVATPPLKFGSRGTGPGEFTNARAIAVDGSGNIYVADYNDGRIQKFDPQGKFVSLLSVGQEIDILSLAAGRDGKLYVPFNGNITIYDADGNVQKVIKGDQVSHSYTHVALGSDGTLYAFTAESSMVHFDKNYRDVLEVKDVFTSVTNLGDTRPFFAVDGLGNMYALGSDNALVLKYSPTGKYIDQFGGRAGGAQPENGKFTDPSGIAVDGSGRIYVSDDFSNLQIFDSSGTYLESINVSGYGVAVDEQNKVYVTTGDQVEVFQVQTPQGQ